MFSFSSILKTVV